jgi:hypothetical protein
MSITEDDLEPIGIVAKDQRTITERTGTAVVRWQGCNQLGVGSWPEVATDSGGTIDTDYSCLGGIEDPGESDSP